jgi:hypothetical protein
MSTRIGQWLKKLATDDETVDAKVLSSEVDASGCQHAAGCWQGQRVTIIGRLRAVDLRPTDALATLVAELYDGTDSVSLIWLGRRSIPGVETGRTVKARGRLALKDGHKVIYNPDYELMPAHA